MSRGFTYEIFSKKTYESKENSKTYDLMQFRKYI